MSSTVASTPEVRTVRRLVLRVTVAASLLATTVVALGSVAWAGTELGC